MKKVKPKKCKACGELFTPFQTTQKACSVKCAMDIAKEKADKKYRKETRIRKEKLKTRSQWIQDAEKYARKYARERDKAEPCISCGRYDYEIEYHGVGGKWDGGHYRSKGAAPELRLHPLNIHKQCKSCNGGSGKYTKKNATVQQSYEVNLREKIGDDMVDWLNGPHEPQKWFVDDLKEIKAYYKEQLKRLENE